MYELSLSHEICAHGPTFAMVKESLYTGADVLFTRAGYCSAKLVFLGGSFRSTSLLIDDYIIGQVFVIGINE